MTVRTSDLPNIPLIESGAEACTALSDTYPELAETIKPTYFLSFVLMKTNKHSK